MQYLTPIIPKIFEALAWTAFTVVFAFLFLLATGYGAGLIDFG